MDDVYDDIDNYNPRGKRGILIVLHDMIADIMTYKKFQMQETEYISYIHDTVLF